jgi:cytochrome b6-f complex iron-sulfur subunit
MSTVPSNPDAGAVIAPKKAAAPGGPPEGQYTRRDFLVLLGWGWLSAALGGFGLGLLKFLFPTVLYEPNPSFKAGRPTDYPLDNGQAVVYTNWQAEQRVWLVSNPAGIYAFEAKCTHLGCTPRWEVASQRFKCPCHGSQFNIEGAVVCGPAPVPLYRLFVNLTQDGQLMVDKARRSNSPSDREKDAFLLKRSRFS